MSARLIAAELVSFDGTKRPADQQEETGPSTRRCGWFDNVYRSEFGQRTIVLQFATSVADAGCDLLADPSDIQMYRHFHIKFITIGQIAEAIVREGKR